MIYTRRNFVKASGALALGAQVSQPGRLFGSGRAPLFPAGYPERDELAKAAIDASMASGASYADSRLTHLEVIGFYDVARAIREENMAFGIRALYQGYWGFASSPIWSREEAVRLGRAAVEQAKANVLGQDRVVELVKYDIPSVGSWETPIEIDPFSIHPDEIIDFFAGMSSYISTFPFVSRPNIKYMFVRNNKTFVSSSGHNTNQIIYQTFGNIGFNLEDRDTRQNSSGSVDELSGAGAGFEYFRNRPIREYIRKAHDEALEDLRLPIKPVEPGRYNVLLDAKTIAPLALSTIGVSTQVDRVFGYEANAGGTSYIDPEETVLGELKIGSDALNISANRSTEGSVGRVRWDDEGIAPLSFDLVKDGKIVDLQSNIEGASWLKDVKNVGMSSAGSKGCASAPTAIDVQLIHNADLHVAPGNSDADRDTLRQQMDEGIEFRRSTATMDFQQISGYLKGGFAFEIKKGKRIAKVVNCGALFRTPELWSSIVEMGGARSVESHGLTTSKGQPAQAVSSSVYTPPATFKDMTIIDQTRKA